MSHTLRDGSTVEDIRLGRIPLFDPRSRDYPVMATIEPTKPRSYTWQVPLRLWQNGWGACVSFAWHHELAARPVMVQGITDELALQRYCEIQAQDPWQGESQVCGLAGPHMEGTSVLTGAQVLKQKGLILKYRWAFSVEDLQMAVGYKGPAVLGLPWYEGMMQTGEKGYLSVTGGIVGGHAILCNRVNLKEQFFGLANSWGQGWGVKDAWGLGGSCRISFDDMDRLLGENGEACIVSGRKLG